MSRRFSDVVWVMGGQGATALGTLLGVRILTQYLPPAAYGVVALALGTSALAITLIAAPLTQAAMHYYPSMVTQGSTHALLDSLRRCFLRMAPWVALTGVVAASVYMRWGGGSPLLVIILFALLASDCWRSANLSLLNAARLHRRYGIWTVADAWGRPLTAVLVVVAVGPSPVAVIATYAIVSVLLVIVFSGQVWNESAPATTNAVVCKSAALDARLWSYALPLVPLGLISWASSLGDRYIIGGLLGLADAGVYAALYGLAGLPFMVVNGALEQGLRPIYQSAVSASDRHRANATLRLWLGAAIATTSVGVVALICGHEWIADLLVGKDYRYASDLMPWISAGYAIRVVSYVFERVCYAHGMTRRVLSIQLGAIAAAIVATPTGVLTLGLKGAAMAVPAYFSVQLALAIFHARRTLREHRATDVVGSAAAANAAEG